LKIVLELREHVKMIAHLNSEIAKADDEQISLQGELQASGSTKTADDVQGELDKISIALSVFNDSNYLRRLSYT
jgi:hypothetical protein